MITIIVVKDGDERSSSFRRGTTLNTVLRWLKILVRDDEMCVNVKEEEVYFGTTLHSNQTITIKKRP